MLVLQVKEDTDTEWHNLNHQTDPDSPHTERMRLEKLHDEWRCTYFTNASFRIIDDGKPF